MKYLIKILILFSGGMIGQTYSPVTVSGFNIDAVAETYPNSLATTTQALDQVVAGGNSVMYSVAFASAAGFTGGLANSGIIINGSKTYQLMPFNGNNALFAPSSTSNTLTLATPASYSNISLLVFSTEGSSSINVTLNYTDLTSSSSGSFSIQDWFFGSGAILAGYGRCKRVTSGATNDGVPSDPRFYAIDIALSCTNQQKSLASITINGISSNPAGGGAYVMAVSGVSVSAVPPSIAYASNAFCQMTASQSPTISGTSGGNFSSSPAGLSINAGTGNINLNASAANTYSVTYTTPGACGLSASYTLTVNPSPTITVNSATMCAGNSTVLTAGGASSFSWSPSFSLNTSTGVSVTANPTTTTIYTVTGTSSGCNGTTTTTITINSALALSVTNATICSGSSTVLTASGASNYTWSTSANTASITVSPTTNTNYTVTGTAAGCTGTATAFVTVNSTPVIALSNQTVCSGSSIALSAFGAATYTWSTGETGSSITVTPSATNVYTVTGSANNCNSSQTATVTVSPMPTVSVPSYTICSGQTAVLTATTNIPGGTYQWFPNNQSTSSISESPLSTTEYTVAYTASGCSSFATATITLKQTPNVTVTSTSICPNQSATITATPSIAGGTFNWTPAISTSASIIDSPGSTTPYSVLYTINGCTAVATGSIIVYPNPALTLTPSSSTISPSETVTISASGGNTYIWNTGDTGQVITENPSQTTTYCATVTANTGCVSNACIEIVVMGESTLYIPNVFTPNGDGVNDVYYTPGQNLIDYDLKIYNRWGQLLFHSSDPLKGWDGNFGGKIIPDGTYVYLIRATGADNVIYNKSGHITVLQ